MATRERNDQSKLIIIIALLIATIGVIGGTLAFFQNTTTVTNTFQAQPYSTEITDTFVSPESWIPGTTTDKEVTVKNTGDVEVAVRLSYTEKWTSANGNELSLTLPNDEKAALVNLINTDDWTYSNGYYYYKNSLAKGESTSSFIDSVTFNSNAVNNYTCTTTDGKISCTSTGDGYDGATYELVMTIETLQSDATQSVWGR